MDVASSSGHYFQDQPIDTALIPSSSSFRRNMSIEAPQNWNKLSTHLAMFESKSREQIAGDVMMRIQVKDHDDSTSLFRTVDSPLLPVRKDSQDDQQENIILSTERLRAPDTEQVMDINASGDTSMIEEDSIWQKKYDKMKKFELEKLCDPKFYQFCLRLSNRTDPWETTYSVYIGAALSDTESDVRLCLENMKLNAEGFMVFEEPRSLIFDAIKQFSWEKEPRALLEARFRVTIMADQESFGVNQSQKIADCIFVYDAYDRISIVSNLDIGDHLTNPQGMKRVSRRIDPLKTLKNNVEAYKDRREKPKIHIYTVSDPASSLYEQTVISLCFKKLRKQTSVDDLHVFNHAASKILPETLPPSNSLVSKSFQHVYYQFNSRRSFHSPRNFVRPNNEASGSPKLISLSPKSPSSPSSQSRNRNPLTRVLSPSTQNSMMIVTKMGETLQASMSSHSSTNSASKKDDTEISGPVCGAQQLPRLDLPIDMTVETKPLDPLGSHRSLHQPSPKQQSRMSQTLPRRRSGNTILQLRRQQ